MLVLFVLLALGGGAAAQWTRDFAFECSRYYSDGVLGDAPDGVVTRAEIARVRQLGLGYLRFIAYFAGYTTDKVLRDCDANGDGFLSDADNRPPTCMSTQLEVDNAVKYACLALAHHGDRYFARLHAGPVKQARVQ